MMNETSHYQLTIIIPVYNEEDNIRRIEEQLGAYLPSARCSACVLLVDDGSTDDSLRRIQEVCRRQSAFFYLSLQHNGGLSTALKAGIDVTCSPYVGYMDADLQTAPEDFDRLLAYIGDYDLVTGIRAHRQDTWFKRMQSKVANGFRRMMTHDGVEDTGCPLKVMHTGCARRLPLFTGMHRFLPALVLLQEGRVKQVPVRHFPRKAGVSKYHLWNRLWSPFIDCFAYRWMKKRFIHYHVSADNLRPS